MSDATCENCGKDAEYDSDMCLCPKCELVAGGSTVTAEDYEDAITVIESLVETVVNMRRELNTENERSEEHIYAVEGEREVLSQALISLVDTASKLDFSRVNCLSDSLSNFLAACSTARTIADPYRTEVSIS